jgi:hypothetical protein
MWHHKLKTLMKTRFGSKVIMFEETLDSNKPFCYVMGGRRH